MNTRRGIYSCSTKIDKIYFRNQLRFVLISFGPLVQTDIKLNEELASIYRSLRSNQEINFQHKKVVRYIR